MTDDEFRELERLAESATPGPWDHEIGERLRSLSENLAVAAALCRAWELETHTFCYEHSCSPDWHPGCGRPAP